MILSLAPRSHRRTPIAGLVALVALVAALVVAATVTRAHKAITSKYTYNEDIYPIVRAHCGACHVDGGIAPMSLMTYNDAYPWAESIKEEIISLRMPPWHAEEGFGAFRHVQTLGARELDILMEWSWGGTPEGDRANRPEPVGLSGEWSLGQPDQVLDVGADGGLPADESEGVRTFSLDVGLADDRWLEAVDLRPGNPAIVRDATITLVATDGRRTVLAAWVPGLTPVEIPGAAVSLPAGAMVDLRIHYKKTWTYEGLDTPDRSAVGLYFSDAEAPAEIVGLDLSSPPSVSPDAELVFGRDIDGDVEVVAIRPEFQSTDVDVRVELVRPDSSREPMLRLDRMPLDWQRRFWFENPLVVSKGSRIEVTAVVGPEAAAALPGDDGDPPLIRVWVDVIARPAAGADQ